MFTAFDVEMMQRAIALAWRGRYSTHPNPRVGCVITHDQRVVGEAWHRKAGEPHAEPLALAMAGKAARGATVYLTLEPHCFQGRTPPCTDALIRAGVARAVIGALDPNPRVNGAGVTQLRAAGVQVDCGLLDEQARELNRGFEARMRTGLPRVVVKLAASLDGRTALANGASQWLTGEAARADVQKLRAEAGAVVTGIGTVLADDPQMNVRDETLELLGRQPLRVVLDSRAQTPPAARILQPPQHTVIFTAAPHSEGAAQLRSVGVEVIEAMRAPDGLDLTAVLRELSRRECNDVLIEAGPMLAGAFLREQLVDELIIYYAPILLGHDGRALAYLPRLEQLDAAPRFRVLANEMIGEDLKVVLRRV